MLTNLRTLSDLFGHDLAGWKFMDCHFLELDHRLMGTFPAVLTANPRKIIFVLEKHLLASVWNRLETRSAKVTTIPAIVNEDGLAFGLKCEIFGKAKSFQIFSEKEINELCRQEGAFKWVPGLVGGSSSQVRKPVFV